MVYKFYPEMGGAESKGRYDALLKKIQLALGEPEEGLAALKPPSDDSANNTTKQ
jgi:hypothetical protein